MRKAIGKGVLVCLLAYVVAIVGAGAVSVATVVAKGEVKADTVDISVQQGDFKMIMYDGSEAESTNVLMDDGVKTHQVAVANEGASCYLRTRSVLKADGRDSMPANDGTYYGDEWKAADDGWFYLTEPLEDGEVISFTDAVQAPEDWRGQTGFEVSEEVTVEAVQSANLTPDFDSENPWADIEASETVHARTEAV